MLHHGSNDQCPTVIQGLASRCPGHVWFPSDIQPEASRLDRTNETPAQHVRNALTIIQCLVDSPHPQVPQGWVLFSNSDVLALKARLEKAVMMLEGK